MPEPKLEAFKAANSSVSQIITLCAGLLAFTATFANDFKAGDTPAVPETLKWCWIALIIAILFGVFALGNTVGAIYKAEKGEEVSITSTNVSLFMMLVAFMGSLILLACAGSVITSNVNNNAPQQQSTKEQKGALPTQ